MAAGPAPGRLATLCQPRTLLVVRYGATLEGAYPCLFLGAAALARLGAVAVYPAGESLRLVAAHDPARQRPWTRHAGAEADRDADAESNASELVAGAMAPGL